MYTEVTERVNTIMGWYGSLDRVDLELSDLYDLVEDSEVIVSIKYHFKSCETGGSYCVDCMEGICGDTLGIRGTKGCLYSEIDKVTSQSSYHLYSFSPDEYFLFGDDEAWGILISFEYDTEMEL